jgi:hypothetical protein
MINTLESQAMALESGSSTVAAVKAMKAGASAQKAQMKELDPDAVNDLQSDIAELQAQHDEVTNLFANSSDPLQDAEIADELEALELEAAEPAPIKMVKGQQQQQQKVNAPHVDLPTAPKGKIDMKTKKQPVAEDEDDDLKALEAEFS